MTPQKLETYKQAIAKSEVSSVEELKNIALSAGLTNEEWLDLLQQAAAYSKKGKELYKNKQKDEAEVYYLRAYELNPVEPDYVFELADLYYRKKEFKKAAKLAEETLRLDPYFPPAASMMEAFNRKQKKKRKLLVKFFLVLALCSLAVVGYVFRNEMKNLLAVVNKPNGLEGIDYEVPIPALQNEQVKIIFGRSHVVHSKEMANENFEHSFSASVSVLSGEVSGLTLRLSYLSAGDTVLCTTTVPIVYQNGNVKLYLYPSDTYKHSQQSYLSLSFGDKKPAKIANIKVEIESIVFTPFKQTTKIVSTPITTVWTVPQESSLKFNQRYSKLTLIEKDSTNHLDMILEVVNEGEKIYKELVVRLEYLDAKNNLLNFNELEIISNDHPPLLAKERLVKQLFYEFSASNFAYPLPYEKLRLNVKKVE
jgi:hypothetical protein